ncbi:hypothetical protein FGB62_195g012 [Gracilaria domingensis]|nr:hypothetical protein FGB62_195g012 [Gracilaria domingensis]
MATACIHHRRHRDNASSLPSAASSTSSSSSWPPRRRRRRRPRAVDPLSLRVAARRRQRRPAGRGAFCARDLRRHPAAACHAAVPAHGALPTLRAKNSVPPAHLARRQALPWRRAPRAHAAGAAVSRAARQRAARARGAVGRRRKRSPRVYGAQPGRPVCARACVAARLHPPHVFVADGRGGAQ